jgi:hypothetical protein
MKLWQAKKQEYWSLFNLIIHVSFTCSTPELVQNQINVGFLENNVRYKYEMSLLTSNFYAVWGNEDACNRDFIGNYDWQINMFELAMPFFVGDGVPD